MAASTPIETSDVTLSDLYAVNGQADDREPWTAGDDAPAIEVRGEDLIVMCRDGVARWTNNMREWSEIRPYHTARVVEEIYESGRGGNVAAATRFLAWMSQFWEATTLADYGIETDADSLVCGTQIQHDASGQGHAWRNVDAADIPADVREEIAAEIIDGGQEECALYVATNGERYRW